MEKIILRIKSLGWVMFCVFSFCGFIQTLLTLNPRVTKLEERVGGCEEKYVAVENRVSGMEIKLDEILKMTDKNNELIIDLYHVIMDKHAK